MTPTEYLEENNNELKLKLEENLLRNKVTKEMMDFAKLYHKEQLNLSGVRNRLNEVALEEINTIMWESHMVKSRTFDRTQGTMIMKELEKWAKR